MTALQTERIAAPCEQLKLTRGCSSSLRWR